MQTLALDKLMPEYQFNERHRTLIHAPSEHALDGVKRATPGEMPLVRLLFAVRSLPAILAGRRGLATGKADPLYEQMLAFGFVLLAEEPDREIVVGVVGQMFKLRGDTPTVRDAREFAAFEAPGYAKAAMNFVVRSVDSRTELTTETRVLTTDSTAKRQFGRYWRVIQPGSAAIRRSWLGAAKRRAERGTETRAHRSGRWGK